MTSLGEQSVYFFFKSHFREELSLRLSDLPKVKISHLKDPKSSV